MDTQSSCSRPRGFSPFFRAPYSDQHMRVSDAERQEVADRLAEHFASGRLDQAEFDDRVGRAMGAKTRADLGGLFADLPEAGAPVVAPQRPRHRHRHPILLLAAIVALIVVATHVVAWIFVPWLWVAFLFVVVLFLTGTLGRPRSRSRHDQDL
jgi:Flp pilus assembly protein TadB